MMKAELRMMCFADEGRGHELNNAALEAAKGKEMGFFLEPPEGGHLDVGQMKLILHF